MSEDNFWGKAPNFEPSAARASLPFIPNRVDPAKGTWGWEQLASGYAADDTAGGGTRRLGASVVYRAEANIS